MTENYEAIKQRSYVLTVEKQQKLEQERILKRVTEQMTKDLSDAKKKQIAEEWAKASTYYGDVIENPSLKIPKSQSTIAH